MRTASCAPVSAPAPPQVPASSIVTPDPTPATPIVEASGQVTALAIVDNHVPNTPVAMSDDVDDDGGDDMIGRMSSCAPVGRMSSCAPVGRTPSCAPR